MKRLLKVELSEKLTMEYCPGDFDQDMPEHTPPHSNCPRWGVNRDPEITDCRKCWLKHMEPVEEDSK